jgi:hypothetical protein
VIGKNGKEFKPKASPDYSFTIEVPHDAKSFRVGVPGGDWKKFVIVVNRGPALRAVK